jgi:outer membrane lipoprotein-sorting protein
MKTLSLPTLALFGALVSPGLVAAPAAASTGESMTAEQILDKALESGAIGFSKGTANLDMLITDAKGNSKQRTMAVKAMTGDDNMLKIMLKFTRPAEVAGMGFLVIQNKNALADQFIYMPAARVTKRVAAGQASGSLFGSDFAYVDLMPLNPTERESAKMTRLDDAKVAGRRAYVISTDIDVVGSPYSKLITYVDAEHLVPLRIEFFDPDGKPLKTLKVKALKKVEKRLIPTKLSMANAQKGTETIVQVRDIQPDAPLSASDFTEEALQR